MYGFWMYVNINKVMSTTQKMLQARMYAKAITVVLLLSNIVLAMKKEEIRKPAPVTEWKVLVKREQEGRKKGVQKNKLVES